VYDGALWMSLQLAVGHRPEEFNVHCVTVVGDNLAEKARVSTDENKFV
jgi:hypothetical protein